MPLLIFFLESLFALSTVGFDLSVLVLSIPTLFWVEQYNAKDSVRHYFRCFAALPDYTVRSLNLPNNSARNRAGGLLVARGGPEETGRVQLNYSLRV